MDHSVSTRAYITMHRRQQLSFSPMLIPHFTLIWVHQWSRILFFHNLYVIHSLFIIRFRTAPNRMPTSSWRNWSQHRCLEYCLQWKYISEVWLGRVNIWILLKLFNPVFGKKRRGFQPIWKYTRISVAHSIGRELYSARMTCFSHRKRKLGKYFNWKGSMIGAPEMVKNVSICQERIITADASALGSTGTIPRFDFDRTTGSVEYAIVRHTSWNRHELRYNFSRVSEALE